MCVCVSSRDKLGAASCSLNNDGGESGSGEIVKYFVGLGDSVCGETEGRGGDRTDRV